MCRRAWSGFTGCLPPYGRVTAHSCSFWRDSAPQSSDDRHHAGTVRKYKVTASAIDCALGLWPLSLGVVAMWLQVQNINCECWPQIGPLGAAATDSATPIKVPPSKPSATQINIDQKVAVEAQVEVCGSSVPQPYGDGEVRANGGNVVCPGR